MPYHLEKGQWFSVVEDYLNTRSDVQLLDMYVQLMEGKPLWEFEYVESTALGRGAPGNPVPTVANRQYHMAVEWFGYEKRDDGSFEPQRTFEVAQAALDSLRAERLETLREARRAHEDAGSPETMTALAAESELYAGTGVIASTGYWIGYHGDVERIMRVSRIRAIEVALGLEPQPVPGDSTSQTGWRVTEPTRRLPIQYFWKCPQRWFEAWITWRFEPAAEPREAPFDDGVVTVLLCTPGAGRPVNDRQDRTTGPPSLTTTISRVPSEPPAAQRVDLGTPATRGMWVVTHADHDVVQLEERAYGAEGAQSSPLAARLPTTPTPLGEWTIPHFGPCLVGRGPVGTWAPSEVDGGVGPHGRPWEGPEPDGDPASHAAAQAKKA